jgi:hypothetical protein
VVFGEVSERLNELVSKTSVLFIEYRGFESHPLRCVASLKQAGRKHACHEAAERGFDTPKASRIANTDVSVFLGGLQYR